MFKVYSQPNCPNCDSLKSYLKEKNVSFEELNVEDNHEARAFMLMNDIDFTPAIYYNGNIISGELEQIKSDIERYSV